MFNKFEEFFNVSFKKIDFDNNDPLLMFITKYGGNSFGNGIYRVFDNEELSKWEQNISEGFPDFKGKFEPFGYDWLGRCFAINKSNNNILMFEIGSADALEIPCSIIDFHNKEIPINNEACLASSFFYEWMNVSKQKLTPDKCAGYKIPLFLGGDDDVSNLELSDMEVYWSICGQIIQQI